jgi:hypothetical protein
MVLLRGNLFAPLFLTKQKPFSFNANFEINNSKYIFPVGGYPKSAPFLLKPTDKE